MSTTFLTNFPTFRKPIFSPLPTHHSTRTRLRKSNPRPLFLPSAASSNGFSWDDLYGSLRRRSEQLLVDFGEDMKNDTGIDPHKASAGFSDAATIVKYGFHLVRVEFVPQFVNWNKLDNWKDIKSWEPKRIGALLLYLIAVVVSSQKIYAAIQAPRIAREAEEVKEAFMEALIPEPTPTNVRKIQQAHWRRTLDKGMKMKKFIEGPNGTMIHDSSFVGEHAWDDDIELPLENVKKIISSNPTLSEEDKKAIEREIGVSASEQEPKGSWRARLAALTQMLEKEELAEEISSMNAKYTLEYDMKEVEKNYRDMVEKAKNEKGSRALWISRRWWCYRPKLPYTYFLQKLDSSEVEAVVFTEDLKRVYVTMKDGFPWEYLVDIPLDPYLFEKITGACVEVDLLQKKQIHYVLKVMIAFLPGLLILWFIRESLMLLHVATCQFLYKKYTQLLDMTYSENFILPIGEDIETKSMHKEVILGGDVWDLLDEIMIYMNDPLQFYERKVPFVRGILLSGLPGTGKTLFARTLSKESGLPFVFASGTEFTDSERSGAAKINEMFVVARRNAPSFVFIDEIDAIAGRHAKNDPRRRATFNALISQLDGEEIKTGIDRFSLRQAVIFICATNRPDELDVEFVRAGRIDRRLYIGLPDAKQRVQIFGVHSAGKQLAEDVDFRKIAREMVISPRNAKLGLTELTKRIGIQNRPDNPDGELIEYRWDDPHVIPADMTLEVSELFTRELTRYIEETEELAIKALEDNRHILDAISAELLEKSRITGLDVMDRLKTLSSNV